MNKGDYILILSCLLNGSAMLMYLWDGMWLKSFYFSGALIITVALLLMKG